MAGLMCAPDTEAVTSRASMTARPAARGPATPPSPVSAAATPPARATNVKINVPYKIKPIIS